MIYRTLGRTNQRISLLGMGSGGHNPLGLASGRSESEMVSLLHRAFSLGINLFDTSPGYGNGRGERIVGQALKELPRDEIVVSTKIALAGLMQGKPMKPMNLSDVGPSVDACLERLQTDYVDVMLMAVAEHSENFDRVIDELIPELLKQKQKGKIRFVGSSEVTRSDGAHQWLERVIPTDLIDVAMVGHNMINQSAQRNIFPLCKRKNIGVINVFTVRNLFWNPTRLKEVIADLKQRGILSKDAVSDDDPFGWLLEECNCGSLVEAAYRYAAYTEPVSTVMCGTIECEELEENVPNIEKGPLPPAAIKRLQETFGHIDEAIGN